MMASEDIDSNLKSNHSPWVQLVYGGALHDRLFIFFC